MTALVTLLAFAAITALFVVLHLRASGGGHARSAPVPCPRCGAGVPADDTQCPRCHAPLQAFELVTAERAPATPPPARGPLHAIVRADRCVGCGTCIAACPEPGAIRLVDKIATVDLDRCKGHGACAAACPVGAIVVTSGSAVQVVEVPEVTAHFESNVPGLYIVGELGGRGLIKNAINEGKIAIEHVARSLAGEPRPVDADCLDVIIVGSGPAGLSAGLEASRSRLRALILEQGSLSDTIARYPRRKLLFAEPLRVPLYGDLWVADATKEELLQVWQNMIERHGLPIVSGCRVESIQREDDGFRVQAGDVGYRARKVVLAMGRRGTPRRLGVPGEELDKVFYDIVEMEVFAGQRVLVVGGGDSAIESAVGLANQPETAVALSYRGEGFSRAKERNQEKLRAAVDAGRIELLLGSAVREIRPDVVVLEHDGTLRLVPNDVVIVRIGGEAPTPFLERLGVHIVRKEIPFASPAAGASG